MPGEENFIEQSSVMHPPQQFVVIAKSYSDGISLRKDGPLITREFSSECILDAERSFRTAATFIPKLVAKHFVTTLTVADDLTYYESIAFERRTVMTHSSETTNIFLPKEKMHSYCSSLRFEPDVATKCYTVGLELVPAQKAVVMVERDYESEGDATEHEEKIGINGDVSQPLNNGVFWFLSS